MYFQEFSYSAYLIFTGWLCQNTNDDSDQGGQPEENHGEVHVVNLGHQDRSGVGLATRRFRVHEVQDHAQNAHHHAHHQAPEGTLGVRKTLRTELFLFFPVVVCVAGFFL